MRTVAVDAAMLAGGGTARLNWALSADGATVVRGGVPVAQAGAAQLLLPMPSVKRITSVVLRLSLERDGAVLASGEHTLHLYPPRPAQPAGVAQKRIVLLDPTGRTAAALDYLGVPYEEASATWTAATGSADMIVVGDSVGADELARFLHSVRGMVSDGVAVPGAGADGARRGAVPLAVGGVFGRRLGRLRMAGRQGRGARRAAGGRA